MRLGGPVFGTTDDPQSLVDGHLENGFAAAFCPHIEDPVKLDEIKHAFAEADIVLAEYGAYCINILDTDDAVRARNVETICERLEFAERAGTLCCVMHGGSVETGGWGRANPENVSRTSFEKSVETVQRIIDTVKPARAKLVMETESHLLPDSPDVYLKLIEAVDRPSFGVHLDPVNLITSPRRFYHNAEFLHECFAKLGPYIVSCHAKDVEMVPHATVQINETYAGNGALDYGVYLWEIQKLDADVPLMIEHLNEELMRIARDFIFDKAGEVGVPIKHAEMRRRQESSK